ncbi:MAG: hypothetical protein AB9872_15500 [Solidesulfovibrio sp.]
MPDTLRRVPLLLTALGLTLLVLSWCAPAQAEALPLEETTLTAMLDEINKYYEESRPADEAIKVLLLTYETDKDSAKYRKMRFLFDTYAKVITSLNNLRDILYIYLKFGNYHDQEINEHIYNRSKSIIELLKYMVYFLTLRNQEVSLGPSTDVQKLYESYLVRLTTLVFKLNNQIQHVHK